MGIFPKLLLAAILVLCSALTVLAAPFGRIAEPPLSERWFGIYVNSERVGFYRQRVDKSAEGYR